MSLQELTASLRQKEDDKSEVMRTLQSLGQLSQSAGAQGRVLFQITECFIEDMKFDIVVLPTDSLVSTEQTDLNNKSLKEETEIYVTSKEVALEIHFLVAGLEYTALLDLPEVPDNSSISMGLESVCAANGAKAEIRIKATFDYIAEMIRSKAVELEQVMEDVKEIKAKVQAAARGVVGKKAAKKAPVRKAAPAAAGSEDDDVEEVEDFDDEEGEEEEAAAGSFTETIQGLVATALETSMQHKAVGMFLITSLAIYFQGDQMSV